jgi:hypothetical protein
VTFLRNSELFSSVTTVLVVLTFASVAVFVLVLVFVVLSVVSFVSLHASSIKQKAGNKAKIFFIQKHLIKILFPE